jgi:hypothetical protein
MQLAMSSEDDNLLYPGLLHGNLPKVLAVLSSISLALNSQEKLDEMGAFGRKRFEDFLCWENQETTLLKLYSRIISQ